ncbi:relaxase domain-containing protein [Corynebacterium sp. HMSC034B08]|uniref:relaxase domain-containing protein n=1 Tax=Corynebacterium sp. HMSC034B08 TaxID=1715135 RepID=UPI001FEEC059|nr:relaxase domain-containing protein [Corynebacterium sp. HMSC034B08]
MSLYHEARAAGTIYQATLRETLAKQFGVAWADVTNGCAEIAGLDDTKMLKAFSTRANEIEKGQVPRRRRSKGRSVVKRHSP